MNVIFTIFMCLVALTLIALALGGDAVVWRMPSYRRFKELVNTLEQASVVRVKGTSQPEGLTLGLIGRHRIPEVFVTTVRITETVTIGDCFGAIFLKEESIDDAVALVKINAWIIVLASLVGTVVLLFENPILGMQLQEAKAWDRVPLLFRVMLEHHFILFAEVVVVLFSVIYLFHNVRLLRRLNRTLQR